MEESGSRKVEVGPWAVLSDQVPSPFLTFVFQIPHRIDRAPTVGLADREVTRTDRTLPHGASLWYGVQTVNRQLH